MPPGYVVQRRPYSGMATLGGVMLGASYLGSLILSRQPEAGDAKSWLYVPVAGPFVSMTTRTVRCPPVPTPESVGITDTNFPPQTTARDITQPAQGWQRECTRIIVREARYQSLLFVDGLFQFAGATLLIAGLLSNEVTLVRETATVVTPHVSERELGLWVQGVF